MKIKCINSGSDGNCFLLFSNDSAILLDLGVRWKGVLSAIEYNLLVIDFAIVTHSHC